MEKITADEVNDNADIEGIFDIEENQYHSIKRVSSSALKAFLKSPKEAEHYLNENIDSPDQEFNPAFVFGSAFHALILEPDLFDSKFIIEPVFSTAKNVNPGRQEWTAFKRTAFGRKIVSQKDWLKMSAMRENLTNNFFYQEFMENAQAEATLFWTDRATGMKCKSRMDAFNPKMGIMDVKTMSEIPTQSECIRAIAKFDYALQQVHYLNGLSHVLPEVPQKFRFLFCSKAGAFDNSNVEINTGDVVFWDGIYRNLLKKVESCVTENFYPGINKDIVEVKLPAWANDKHI
jgi:exodeoxyribonuclease VIII